MQISERIRDQRTARGISKRKLAAMLGVTPPAVNLWERGVTVPCGKHQTALAAILDIPAEQFPPVPVSNNRFRDGSYRDTIVTVVSKAVSNSVNAYTCDDDQGAAVARELSEGYVDLMLECTDYDPRTARHLLQRMREVITQEFGTRGDNASKLNALFS
jgi:transcriptional regulator with XRE-family HTH domain